MEEGYKLESYMAASSCRCPGAHTADRDGELNQAGHEGQQQASWCVYIEDTCCLLICIHSCFNLARTQRHIHVHGRIDGFTSELQ